MDLKYAAAVGKCSVLAVFYSLMAVALLYTTTVELGDFWWLGFSSMDFFFFTEVFLRSQKGSSKVLSPKFSPFLFFRLPSEKVLVSMNFFQGFVWLGIIWRFFFGGLFSYSSLITVVNNHYSRYWKILISSCILLFIFDWLCGFNG